MPKILLLLLLLVIVCSLKQDKDDTQTSCSENFSMGIFIALWKVNGKIIPQSGVNSLWVTRNELILQEDATKLSHQQQ